MTTTATTAAKIVTTLWKSCILVLSTLYAIRKKNETAWVSWFGTAKVVVEAGTVKSKRMELLGAWHNYQYKKPHEVVGGRGGINVGVNAFTMKMQISRRLTCTRHSTPVVPLYHV